jgi:hypothetical protein
MRWTSDEDAALLRIDTVPRDWLDSVARVLGRSPKAITNRWYTLHGGSPVNRIERDARITRLYGDGEKVVYIRALCGVSTTTILSAVRAAGLAVRTNHR